MAALYLPDELVRKVEEAAQRQNQSVESLVENWLENVENDDQNNESATPMPDNEENGLLKLARTAEALNLRSGYTDTSSRIREILNTDYVDYLIAKRLNRS
jgi:hypothetical protein